MFDTKHGHALMRTTVIATALIVLTLNIAACGKKPPVGLTEESLRKFYDASLAAVGRRDAKGSCAQYADNAEIKLIKFTQSGSEKTMQSKAEFCKELEASYAQLEAAKLASSIKVDITNIAITADGNSADVQVTVTESIQIMGQSINAKSEQTDHIELTGGKPLITHTTGRITETS